MNANDNAAATLLNILTAITLLVPAGVPVDEMVADDVADARGAWEFHFSSIASRDWLQSEGIDQSSARVMTPDGRNLRLW